MSGIYRSEAGARLLRENYLRTLESWPVDTEHLRAPTPEGETFVSASGPATAPALLLLHGSGSDSTQWMSRIADLATQFRVYAVDVIGEPGLSAPSRPALASQSYAVWLDAVLDFLKVGRVSIMGMSLGGWLALDYAIRRPDRVRRMALLCPLGIGRSKKAFLLKAMLLNPLGRWGRRKTVKGMLGPGLSIMDPTAATWVVDHVSFVSKNYRHRTSDLPIFDDNSLRGLTMPIHVFAGQADVVVDSVETKRRLEATAAQSSVRVLPGIGHYIPDQTAAELEFLTGSK